jgi:hypothetical protein
MLTCTTSTGPYPKNHVDDQPTPNDVVSRADPTVPIELTVREMAKLVKCVIPKYPMIIAITHV